MPRLLTAAPLLLLAFTVLLMASPKDVSAAQPNNIWLPWEGGSLWRYIQGPHGGWTEGLDFQPPDAGGRPCEAFHSSFWVVAAADGVVAPKTPNTLEIDHGNGFTTGYYHLELPIVQPGDKVASGQRIGLPGCCPDGWGVAGCYSEAPHLHFYTKYNGQNQSMYGINIGGWLVDSDGCMRRTDQVSCPLGGSPNGSSRIVSNSPRQGENAPSTTADLALILDTSNAVDSGQEEARIDTALALLQATRPDDNVSVISFSSTAKVRAPLRPAVLNNAIDNALVSASSIGDTGGRTNIRLGLVTGCAELLAKGKASARAAILISDGKHNKGNFAGAEECFAEAGIPVFTYGTQGAAPYLLRRVAENTGGEFQRLADIPNLYCEFLRVRTLLSGDPPGGCSTVGVKPGAAVELPFKIPAEQDQAVLEVRWRERRTVERAQAEGLPVKVDIMSPLGEPLTIPFPGITYEERDGAARYTIAWPMAGEWKIIVTPTDKTPETGLFITFSASTIPQAPPYIVLPPPPEETPSDTPAPTDDPSATDAATDTPTPEPTATLEPRPTRTSGPTDPPSETPIETPSPTEPTTESPTRSEGPSP